MSTWKQTIYLYPTFISPSSKTILKTVAKKLLTMEGQTDERMMDITMTIACQMTVVAKGIKIPYKQC